MNRMKRLLLVPALGVVMTFGSVGVMKAATFDGSCEVGCKTSGPGAYLKFDPCSSVESSKPGCRDIDSKSSTFNKDYNCCVPKVGSCGAKGGECLNPGTCITSDKSTETGFAYKIISDGTCADSAQWCCQKLPPRPGYVADTYDESACDKLGGVCLPPPCSSVGSSDQIGDCGKKGGLSFVCCKEKPAAKESASTGAAKEAAGGVGGSTTGSAAAKPKEKPLVTADTFGYIPPLKNLTLPQIVGNIIKGLSPVVGALFFGMFLWGGFQWITAGGDSKQVETARKTLTSAVIGIAIVIGAYVLVANVVAVLGNAVAK